jgi:hypothetical protein
MTHTRFQNRALSHSQLSSWEYSKEEWYKSYILGERSAPSAEMIAGSIIGDAIGTPDNPIPDLNPPGVKEFELHANWEGINMIGYCDHYCPDMRILHENKTSPNKRRWTQRKVDEHNQLTMYALMLNLRDGIEPEDIEMYLNFIPVALVGVTYKPLPNWKQFETRRTKQHLEAYKQYIMRTVEEMDKYIKIMNDKPLSTPTRRAPSFNGVQ